jgi:8-oxo-dGTP pyrophosphatase MutT (NUDIX family)
VSPTVRSAATVILLRDGMDGLETFLLRRVASMAFAPRMHVFPGGRLDEIDFTTPITLTGADPHALAERASSDVDELRALYACAVRETREEVGIELGTITCDGALQVDPGELPIVDHWVTPEAEPRRYDVRFFAAMVTGDEARLTTTEADEALWMQPLAALEAFTEGRMPMLPPTESVLRWLSGFSSAADAVMAGGARTVRPLLPRRLTGDDGRQHWAFVHDRTGEVLKFPVEAPHTRESDGRPLDSP